MPKYLILEHYRGSAPATVNDVPMDRWTPEEVDAHMTFMDDFGKRLEANGEFVDAQALSPEGAGGKPIHEWLEVRPFYGAPTATGD